LRGVRVCEEFRDLAEESFSLDVAVGAEASGDGVEVAIIVAGVAAELVGSCVG
jgi:hypothetical protein